MAEPWKCPECGTWNAPDVKEHRCDPGGGVPAKVGGGSPGPTTTGGVITTTLPATWTVTNPPIVTSSTLYMVGLGSAA